MGGRESDQEETSGERDANTGAERAYLLVITGWIMIVVGLVWVWMVFFTKQDEIGLWIAAAICGLGYLLQRAGNQAP